MPTVRTTMEPDKEIVVSEREAYGLRQQGLLVEEDVDEAPATDPSMATDTDAVRAHEEDLARRREQLGEDKDKGRGRGAKARNEGS